jgi:polyisoprenyl-teichoic acid--peptidoglycan teichoic acid transferase
LLISISNVGRNDFQRTERQRAILTQIFRKLTSMNTSDALASLDIIFPNVETSLSKTNILSDVSYVITNKIKTISQLRLPEDKSGYNYSKYINGVYFLEWNKTGNIADLHQFIFEGDLK